MRVKLAEYGWHNRRAVGHGGYVRRESSNEGISRETGREGLRRTEQRTEQRTRVQENRSYVEALSGNLETGSFDDKEPRCMKWEGSHLTAGWFSKTALGVLKQFLDISTVNQRLLFRGFSFSSQFLGDKNIIWQFDEESDCIGFIKNRFFWDDCFVSIELCTQEAVARSRLMWIEVHVVPLRCWHDSFFMSVGRRMGIPLLIEEDTRKKSKLDRGRLLISIPIDSKCPKKIKVQDRSRLFEISIVVDETPVDQIWINRLQGELK
ncbi:hypothetical protein LWI28_003879 [Acer negundo]|uniref:DUF4283 domain-containing protein n=1 Tax=Acer negundo TaxID=4023 RepID=A0AAD5NIQ2_ACENE|nr:hypothetical protein LWI28_003879 [Acer negundo]